MRHARARLRWAVGVLTTALVVTAGVVLTLALRSTDDLASRATVSASSDAVGSSPRDAVTTSSGSGELGWQSSRETIGAWLELQWSKPQALRRVVIERNALDEPGITGGFLTFGDGSQLQLRLSTTSTRTVLPFTVRSVDSVRFTVTAVSQDARSVSIAELRVSDRPGSDDVATDVPADGDVAPLATVSDDTAASASNPAGLTRISGEEPGWTVPHPTGAWVQLTWPRARELTTVQLSGSAASDSTLGSATLTFSDGSQLPVGAVLASPGRPTRISFMPRVTTSLRLTLDSVTGDGALTLQRLRAYPRGAALPRLARGGSGKTVTPASADCPRRAGPTPARRLVVLCPTNGSAVGERARLLISATGRSTVRATAWPADPQAAVPPTVQAPVAGNGEVALVLDLHGVPAGPLTVRLQARGGRRRSEIVYLQLDRRGRGVETSTPADAPASGHSLVYDEEFVTPLSLSRTGAGADYAAAKPTSTGADDFGSAIFADPALGLGNVGVVDHSLLRIRVQPKPRTLADPYGWQRTHTGGLLASARTGGSGFSAQYGYFEARMLTPAAAGTWPAFWMLSSTNLIAPQPVVPEIDAVELYGHDPTAACETTHEYANGKDGGVARCGTRFDSVREALSWHTYGVSIGPTTISYYIDGDLVATAPQVGGGGDPMFFLLDLALGGGWPIDLAGTRERADLYVDYVRVYV